VVLPARTQKDASDQTTQHLDQVSGTQLTNRGVDRASKKWIDVWRSYLATVEHKRRPNPHDDRYRRRFRIADANLLDEATEDLNSIGLLNAHLDSRGVSHKKVIVVRRA